jgi:hypothetical protein
MNKAQITSQIIALQEQLRLVEIEEARQARIAKETAQRNAMFEIEGIMANVKALISKAAEIAGDNGIDFDLSDSDWGLTNVPGVSEDWNSSNCY